MDIFSRIIGEVILWLVAMVLWITANLPAILMYTVPACCAIIPLAFWLFSMDNTIAWFCTVFGVQRGMTWNHFKQGGNSVGSDRIDKRPIDNRANFSIINYRPSIMIIIDLGGEGPGRIYPSYSLF
jgi:hypothetical protein